MSTLNVSNITDGTDTVETGYVLNGSAKAWVNFNGTGTIATRNSLNVSSLTDNNVGSYNVNFTNSFSGSYSLTALCSDAGYGGIPYIANNSELATGSSYLAVFANKNAVNAVDVSVVCKQITGDLA
jgi:hypothetical protein